MATVTRWNNLDLIIKPVIVTGSASAKADPYTRYFQQVYVALGGPPVKNGKGQLKPLVVDGQPGPQTRNAAKVYMAANGLPGHSGNLDQQLYFYLDWQAYNLFGDRWKPCGLTVTSMGNGGPAISKGHNGVIVSPLIRVDIEGQGLMNQRLCDVEAVFLGQPLGGGRSVLRFGRGTTNWSWHGKAGGNDESGDLDKDKVIEEHEKRKMRALWDYMLQRARSVPAKRSGKYTEKQPTDMSKTQVRTFVNMGPDYLQTKVCGNLRYSDGTRMWPEHPANGDVSASAANNWVSRGSTRKVHVAPFHNHSDCTPFGAPTANPFK